MILGEHKQACFLVQMIHSDIGLILLPSSQHGHKNHKYIVQAPVTGVFEETFQILLPTLP